jgi:hypothetical protein
MSRDVEAIAASYISAAEGDRDRALRLAIFDALADVLEAKRRTMKAVRPISFGYARGEFGLGRDSEQDLPPLRQLALISLIFFSSFGASPNSSPNSEEPPRSGMAGLKLQPEAPREFGPPTAHHLLV